MEFLREDFTERTTHNCEILRKHEYFAPVDGSPTGYDPIGVGTLCESGFMCPVTSQHVEFVERALIEQVIDALPGQHLAFFVLARNGTLRTCMQRLILAFTKIVEFGVH